MPQVFMWDSAGTVEFSDTVCSQNAAEVKGGCVFTDGRGIVNPGTTMEGNSAKSGGCICECYISACHRGGFLQVSNEVAHDKQYERYHGDPCLRLVQEKHSLSLGQGTSGEMVGKAQSWSGLAYYFLFRLLWGTRKRCHNLGQFGPRNSLELCGFLE